MLDSTAKASFSRIELIDLENTDIYQRGNNVRASNNYCYVLIIFTASRWQKQNSL